jgi:hypothetical protein
MFWSLYRKNERNEVGFREYVRMYQLMERALSPETYSAGESQRRCAPRAARSAALGGA